MASVGQGAKQRVPPYFQAEHDNANRSFKASFPSILEKPSFHEDTTVQVCAPACLSKGSTASDTFTDPPAMPHWMSSKQVQTFLVNTRAKSGLTTHVVPSTSMPQLIRHNSQVHETIGPLSRLPSSKSVLSSEGQDNTCKQSRSGMPKSRHLFQQQLPARSPLSVGLSPLQGLKRDEQRVDPEISKKDLLSLLLHKQEKKQGSADLFPGHSAGKPLHYSAEMSSWVSKFPFQIVPTVEEAEERNSIQLRGPRQGASKGVANVPSQLVGSKVQIDHSKVLVHHSPSLTEAASSVIPANFLLKSPCPLPAALTNSNMPSLKRDWTATLTQCVNHPQLLPDFFSQQKVISSTKVDRCHPCKSDGNPEMNSTVFFSQKSSASRVDEENVGFNLPSLNGAIYSGRTRNSSDYKNLKQHDLGCGREAQRTRTSVLEQHLDNSLQHVDLPKVKLETFSEGSGNAECGKLVSRECTDKHDKIASSERRFSTEVPLLKGNPDADHAARQLSTSDLDGVIGGNSQSAELMLFKESASTQVLGVSSSVSACVPYLPFLKQSQNLKGLERDSAVPANKYAQIVADWGEFLAAPSIGQTAETHLLPFQQRFMQLQKFLQKCDGSNKEYCLQALRSLSATARSDHAAELESRAVRLSLEEGKEMKRAKLLHILEELPEGTYVLNPCARPTGSLFSTPRAVAVVKEEDESYRQSILA